MAVQNALTRINRQQRHDWMGILLLCLVFWAATAAIHMGRVSHADDARALAQNSRLDAARQGVIDDLGRAGTDLRVLARNHALTDAQPGFDGQSLSALRHAFVVWANESKIYDQIRLLDLRGRERVRVNWDPQGATVVADEELQDKADRYYFRDAIALASDEIYISSFDLNIENGIIEIPFKPMLRFASPVFNSTGEKLGVLVLNYLGDSLLHRLAAPEARGDRELELVDADGQWLHAVDPDNEWGAILPHGRYFSNRYPAGWQRISTADQVQFMLDGDLFSAETIYPIAAGSVGRIPVIGPDAVAGADVSPYHWKLVARVPAAAIAAANQRLWRDTLGYALPLFLLLLLAAGSIARLRDRRRRAESALALSERGKRSIVENALDAILTVNERGVIVDANPSARELFAGAFPDGAEVLFEHLLAPASSVAFRKSLNRTLGLNSLAYGERLELRMKAGAEREFDAELALSPVADSYQPMVSVFIRDVSERKKMEMTMREHSELLERQVEERTRELSEEIVERKSAEDKLRQAAKVFENTREAIIITNPQCRVVAANAAFSHITGIAETHLIGQMPWLFDEQLVGIDLLSEIENQGSWQGQLEGRRADGSAFPTWMSVSAVRNPYGRLTNYVAVFSDISEIKRSQARLDYLAHHDSLTRLPNRVMFNSLLDNAIVRARRATQRLAVLFVDLDRFKAVNDSLGHDAGDELLKVVSHRLRATIREADTLARMGGDEFTVLLDAPQTREEAGLVASKLINAVREPVSLRGTQVYVGASIGISMYPEDGDSVDTLLRNADVAMFSAKQGGRDRFQYSTVALIEAADHRVDLERDLRGAVKCRQMFLMLQMQLELAGRRPAGAEALLRWQHPSLGLLLPAGFLDLAEDTGLIHPLGNWVMRNACAILADWRRQGLQPARLSVNLSARQLREDGLVESLGKLLSEHHLPPGCLELDLPESILQPRAGIPEGRLEMLREIGVALALDNFGGQSTVLGSSALLHLDRVKLDPALIQDLVTSPAARRIVGGLLDFARSLKLPVLAKGIESAAQARILRELGCQFGQGYALGRPQEPAVLTALLTADESRPPD